VFAKWLHLESCHFIYLLVGDSDLPSKNSFAAAILQTFLLAAV
jgi:hypothetical protein